MLCSLVFHIMWKIRIYKNYRAPVFDLLFIFILMVSRYNSIHFYSLRPKLLECFDWNTKIKEFVRNLWGICENAQLGSNLSLNKLSNELFYTQNEVVNRKIWWFNHAIVCHILRTAFRHSFWVIPKCPARRASKVLFLNRWCSSFPYQFPTQFFICDN
jgi:hypothetical protein